MYCFDASCWSPSSDAESHSRLYEKEICSTWSHKIRGKRGGDAHQNYTTCHCIYNMIYKFSGGIHKGNSSLSRISYSLLPAFSFTNSSSVVPVNKYSAKKATLAGVSRPPLNGGRGVLACFFVLVAAVAVAAFFFICTKLDTAGIASAGASRTLRCMGVSTTPGLKEPTNTFLPNSRCSTLEL